jgi:ABC-type glycerol-3-phosphate transport system substrate-binding protein
MKRLLLLVPALALGALVLSACGGGETDEDKIVSAIETSATSTDPADCEALGTLAFIEQTAGGSGQEAVKKCEEETKDTTGDPDSVEVSEVQVDGSDATADAKFVGGNFDGQTLTIALVDEGGDWKLDQLVGFVDFKRDGLIGSFEESLGESDEIPAAVRSCIVKGLEELADEELESLVINNEEDAFVELAEECQAT